MEKLRRNRSYSRKRGEAGKRERGGGRGWEREEGVDFDGQDGWWERAVDRVGQEGEGSEQARKEDEAPKDDLASGLFPPSPLLPPTSPLSPHPLLACHGLLSNQDKTNIQPHTPRLSPVPTNSHRPLIKRPSPLPMSSSRSRHSSAPPTSHSNAVTLHFKERSHQTRPLCAYPPFEPSRVKQPH